MRSCITALVLLNLLWLVGCETAVSTPIPPPTPTLPTALMGDAPVQPLFQSPSYGVQAFLWWKEDTAQRDVTLINEMGFGWVKQNFPWRDIEGIEKGAYDWYRPEFIVNLAENAGLNLLVRLDHQPLWAVSSLPDEQITDNQPPVDYKDFGDYCGAVAAHFKGRIAAYQVWNEPNLSREWGNKQPNPTEYTALLKECYTAIKTADPAAIVISAGLAPTGNDDLTAMPDTKFLQGMYDAGASAYFDVLGLNAPGYKAPPETPLEEVANPDNGYGGGRWFAFRHVEDMRAIMVANGDGHKQVSILEMGWILQQDIHTTYTWHGVSEQEQADYLARAYQYAADHWQPWIGLMTTVYIADYHWTPEANEQWWWSIILPDGTPRQAFFALSNMEK